MTIVAAADGSALGNPGPAGWAWYVDEHAWAAGGWPHGTNNQGELMAVVDLLESTATAGDDLRILCDSQYVINAVTKWMPGWKRKGWRKADGTPVLNRELLERLDAALRGRSYRFEWVKGHTGHPLNEAADRRARAVATAYQNGSAIDGGPGWPGEPGTPGATEALFGDELEDADETPEEIVVRLERELLDPAIRLDVARMAQLLHPEFEEIGRSGRLWARDALLEELEDDTPGAVSVETVGASRPTPESVLLVLRTSDSRGTALRSSLWLRDGDRWRLRFHQATPSD